MDKTVTADTDKGAAGFEFLTAREKDIRHRNGALLEAGFAHVAGLLVLATGFGEAFFLELQGRLTAESVFELQKGASSGLLVAGDGGLLFCLGLLEIGLP